MPAGALEARKPSDQLIALFERERGVLPSRALDARRAASFARFLESGVPTTQNELWKYTNLRGIDAKPLARGDRFHLGALDVADWFAGGVGARRLVFANGVLDERASHCANLPEGVRVESLAKALSDRPDAVAAALEASAGETGLAQLNEALVEGGAWIELDDGVALDEPLQLLFFHKGGPAGGQGGDDAAAMVTPRIFLSLGAGASMHLIESHVGRDDGALFVNLVNQISVREGASLRWDRLQRLGKGASFVSKTLATVAGEGRFDQSAAVLGGALVRNESEIRITGENADAKLAGFFMPKKDEHVDTAIRMHHQAAHCESDQLFKGVLDESGRGVFQGKVIVHEDAQKTNAYQTNNNLLLSDEAEIDSKPELEIYADDVKCSHGATIGDLDEREIFYLQSRGLDRAKAEAILTYAFIGEAIARIGDPDLRRQASEGVIARLGDPALDGLLDEAA